MTTDYTHTHTLCASQGLNVSMNITLGQINNLKLRMMKYGGFPGIYPLQIN